MFCSSCPTLKGITRPYQKHLRESFKQGKKTNNGGGGSAEGYPISLDSSRRGGGEQAGGKRKKKGKKAAKKTRQCDSHIWGAIELEGKNGSPEESQEGGAQNKGGNRMGLLLNDG